MCDGLGVVRIFSPAMSSSFTTGRRELVRLRKPISGNPSALEVVLLELDADLAADRAVEHLVGVAEAADDPRQVERALARVDAGEERVAGEREVDHPAARPGEDGVVVAELPGVEYLDPHLAAGALLDELRELHDRGVLRIGVGLGVREAELRFLGVGGAACRQETSEDEREYPVLHLRSFVVRVAARAGAAMLPHAIRASARARSARYGGGSWGRLTAPHTAESQEQTRMTAAELLVKCLENEGVEFIFGVPGEENIDVMDALLDSPIKFVTTRHEQGAAFMADVYGRLTGRAGVCLATLGPGATNLITGVADANMDRAPLVAIAGQGATTRLHKESHQILDLVNLFHPITKYSTQIREPEIVPEIVRKAFKVAVTEKPGCCFIDFPENIAEMKVDKKPITVQTAYTSTPPDFKIEEAARIIARGEEPGDPRRQRRHPAGRDRVAAELRRRAAHPGRQHVHGEGRGAVLGRPLPRDDRPQGARPAVVRVREGGRGDLRRLRHGRVPPRHVEPGRQQDDRAHRRAAGGGRRALHRGDRRARRHRRVAPRPSPCAPSRAPANPFKGVRQAVIADRAQYAEDQGFPVKPQKIVWDLRKALAPEDIVISDVGAHKMWMARMYQAQEPNTCIISNGFASMGIGVPGAIAAKLAYPIARSSPSPATRAS